MRYWGTGIEKGTPTPAAAKRLGYPSPQFTNFFEKFFREIFLENFLRIFEGIFFCVGGGVMVKFGVGLKD